MTSKKVFGALGLAAVLGVAGVAMTGVHAAFEDQTDKVTYQVTIGESQSIQSSTATVSSNAINGELATAPEMGSLSHTLTYSTNNTNGYTVTASVETDANLSDGASHSIAYSNEAIAKDAGESDWNLSVTGTDTIGGIVELAEATSDQIATGNSPASGVQATITFAAFVDATQNSGTYSKEVTYTLAAI